MDRFAANTLRTLGIVLISIFVFGASAILLLLALCLGALGGSSRSDQNALVMCILGAAVLITGGVVAIAKLSKGIVRGTPEYQDPLSMGPAARAQFISEFPREVAAPPTSSPVNPAPTEATLHPTVEATSATQALKAPPPFAAEPRARVDVAHLRPASRVAIRNLALAISGKLAAEILLTLSGSFWSYRVSHAAFASFRYTFIAWGIAAVAPLMVLLYALLRHPGPRAFAYSLVIPGLHLFFGIFGHSATLFMLFRTTPGLGPMFPALSLLPWLLDILILHLAWKAIRITGIQPNSTRLIVASTVIFVYTSVLPFLFVIINNVWHLH